MGKARELRKLVSSAVQGEPRPRPRPTTAELRLTAVLDFHLDLVLEQQEEAAAFHITVIWAALREKVLYVLSRCHTKRRIDVRGRAQPSFGMTPTFQKKKKK